MALLLHALDSHPVAEIARILRLPEPLTATLAPAPEPMWTREWEGEFKIPGTGITIEKIMLTGTPIAMHTEITHSGNGSRYLNTMYPLDEKAIDSNGAPVLASAGKQRSTNPLATNTSLILHSITIPILTASSLGPLTIAAMRPQPPPDKVDHTRCSSSTGPYRQDAPFVIELE